MVKVLQIVAVGLATTTLAVLAGCSQAPAPDADSSEHSNASNSAATDEAKTSEQNGTTAADAYRPVENITFPAPGADPLAMVFSLRQFQGETVGSEQLKVTYPTPEQAIVISTVRGLPDDSVNSTRTRYEFKPVEGQVGQWQMVKVSQQNKCQAGRGSEEWTAELCN